MFVANVDILLSDYEDAVSPRGPPVVFWNPVADLGYGAPPVDRPQKIKPQGPSKPEKGFLIESATDQF